MLEFCENGAKAIADEATKKRRYSRILCPMGDVDALERQPDVWLNAQGRLTHPMALPRRLTTR